MNKHVIFGAVEKKPRLIQPSSGKTFVSIKIADKTKYNGKDNPSNTYEIIKYGEPNEMDELMKINTGVAIYVSGTGLYNKKGFYNIIADEIHPLEKIDPEIKVEEPDEKEDDYLAHLKAAYEEQLVKDDRNEK